MKTVLSDKEIGDILGKIDMDETVEFVSSDETVHNTLDCRPISVASFRECKREVAEELLRIINRPETGVDEDIESISDLIEQLRKEA
jgi:hypothetical protein